jgi:hypothetical protein
MITAATRHNLPGIGTPDFPKAGGLMSYTDLRKFLDTGVFIFGEVRSQAPDYRADEAGAQPTAQSERIKS